MRLSCPGQGAAHQRRAAEPGPIWRLGRPALWAPALLRTAEEALRCVRSTQSCLLPPAAERVAGLDRALLVAGHEPLLAMSGRAVCERVRHCSTRGLTLQRIVADRARGGQRGVDVAGLQAVRTLLRLAIDPDAGQAVGLQ